MTEKRVCSTLCAALSLVLFAFAVGARADDAGRPQVTPPSPSPANDKNWTAVEKFVFDAGSGDSVANSVAGGSSATLHNTTWVSPGYNGAKSAVRLDGKTSNVPLENSKTPEGPIAMRFVVRPAELRGLLFGDIGGLTVTVLPSGHIAVMRANNGQWVYLESKDSVAVGQWSTVECQWVGSTSRVFINGQFSGEAPAPSSFKSAGRGLGCNFWGPTSDYYCGDIASYELMVPK